VAISRTRAPLVAVLTLGVVASGMTALPAPAAAVAERGDCRSGYVSLTFDDGPATPTGRLLKILREAHVHATFFMVGQRVAATPRVARRVERAGFLIGNHSWAHTDMTTQTSAQVAATLRATDTALRRAGTHPTRLMRPPYGALDHTARAGIRAAGFVPVLWTIDSRDWESGTSGQIAARILAALRPNATNIVLQHDGVQRSPISVASVPRVIHEARRRGYCFAALDEHGRPGFPTPTASISVTNTREGRPAVTTIGLDKPAGRATSVVLWTRSRSATIGKDVDRVRMRVIIPAGRLARRVRIPVPDDGPDERREGFEVTIGRPSGVRIGVGSAKAQIRDVDPPPRILGVDATVSEPTDTAATVDVQFPLSHISEKRIRVVVATHPGSADNTDFSPVRRHMVIRPGQASLIVPVEVLADALDETDEEFTVKVLRGVSVRIRRPATVTITPPPSALSTPEGAWHLASTDPRAHRLAAAT
jgi:peptidoglycan/xylan/chitin deacetylase (PgdA/CDA1 family)